MPDIEAQLDGESHVNWSTLGLDWSMEQAAIGFTMGFIEALEADVPDTMEPATGKHARVLLEGEPACDGYVFSDRRKFDESSYTLDLAGRSRAADLLDCDAINKKMVFRNAGLEHIAAELVGTFGGERPIEIRWEGDEGKKFGRYVVEQGESVFSALARAAKQRGLLIMSAADGAIVFVKVSTTRATESLTVGGNVLGGGSNRDDTDRFSEYHFRGQTSADDDWFGVAAADIRGKVTDPRILRYRPTVSLDGQGPREDPGRRALWARNTSYGHGQRFHYEVDGWLMSTGKVWSPNQLVHVEDPLCHVGGELLLVSARMSLDEAAGKRTNLEVCPPEAFDLVAA